MTNAGGGTPKEPWRVGQHVRAVDYRLVLVARYRNTLRTGQVSQAGKTGDDRGVRVLLKMSDRRQAASNWRSSAVSWMPIAFSTTGG